jgi:glycosyltransferase 2 family protein
VTHVAERDPATDPPSPPEWPGWPTQPPGVAPTPGTRTAPPIQRHPGDILRVVVGGVLLAVTAAVAVTERVSTFERDLFRLVNHLTSALEIPLIGVMQAGAVATVPVCAVVALAARRPRLARDLAVSGTAAWLLAKVVKDVVSRGRPDTLLSGVIIRHASDTGLGFPSGHAAVAAALATAAGPFLPRRARQATWLGVALVCVGRIYVGSHLPDDLLGGVALGWIVGAAWHLAVGAPTRGISGTRVTRLLESAGFAPVAVTPVAADARGSTPFNAVTRTGSRLFVKAVDREHRNADLLFKLWRRITLRHVEDEAPFVTPKQQVEHEALLLLLAARAGVRVPGTLTGVQAGRNPALLVLEHLEGRPLDRIHPPELTPALLRAVWEQVDRLQRARIAHRDLRAANILVDAHAQPWIVDFGFAELSASDRRLAQDVAELLASTALLVGPARAVDAATDVLGLAAVARAIPLLQPLALSVSTRSAVRHHPELLAELRHLAGDRTGAEAAELDRLARIRPTTILWLVLGLFGVHLLLPQVGELHQTLDTLGQARVGWLAAALVMSAGTYLAAAVAQMGTVAPALPLGRTVAVQVAGSFANRFTPAGLGNIGVSTRYLERSGLARPEAVGASTATSLAGLLVHVVMLLAAGLIVGQGQVEHVRLPSGWLALVIVAAALALIGFTLGTVTGRTRLLAPTERSLRALAEVMHRPRRAVELFGGSFAITAFYIATLLCTLHAFGGHLGWTKVALAYLGGSAVAAAAPTPGGLGAVEAALIAGLTALGATAAPSIAGVLAFRLATFWLPIAPGWIAFRLLRKRGVI